MSQKNLSILIIEDSVSITTRMLRFLKEINNLEIIGSVRNGTSGLKRIKSDLPDIILLDIQLPGLNGMQIMESLQKELSKPYVIVLTNNSNLYFKEKCFELGANEFFDKSVQFEAAIESIRKLCNAKTAA